MKALLAAINAKYIHSNPAVYSLKAYSEAAFEKVPSHQKAEVEIGEYTINHRMGLILQDIYRRKPDLIGFSCYIWNISYVRQAAADIKKVLPKVEIWFGGPEVSYDADQVLKENPAVRGVMRGEGELVFTNVLKAYAEGFGAPEELCGRLCQVPGITVRMADGTIKETPPERLLSMDEIPFYYKDISDFENRIVYYESSRGCPFSCSYCLSSVDKSVRFRSISRVLSELDFFLSGKVPQVKFVDRTFNCKEEHTMAIWRHLAEHDNGVTNFHFEISADLLNEEELALIKTMRPGLIQLEIGVQSTNPDTIQEIRRTMELRKLSQNVAAVKSFSNTHQHLDLIAGLPFEGMESFLRSFDAVYRMEPDQLQLGFLKVLKGSYMETRADAYDLRFSSAPPYEILSTKWLEYGDIIRLKGMEEMVENYHNSSQFTATLPLLEQEFESPSAMYLAMADYYDKNGFFGPSQSRLFRYEILYRFICERLSADLEGEAKRSRFRDALTTDLYLRENVKSRLSFSMDQAPFKEAVRDFFKAEEERLVWLTGYEGYDARQMAKMAHLEAMEDGTFLLFDYKSRSPLNGNARAVRFQMQTDDMGCKGKENKEEENKEEEGKEEESEEEKSKEEKSKEEESDGSERNKESKKRAGGTDPGRPGRRIWNRIPLLLEL